MKRNLKMVK